jgi:hypothetical protein
MSCPDKRTGQTIVVIFYVNKLMEFVALAPRPVFSFTSNWVRANEHDEISAFDSP